MLYIASPRTNAEWRARRFVQKSDGHHLCGEIDLESGIRFRDLRRWMCDGHHLCGEINLESGIRFRDLRRWMSKRWALRSDVLAVLIGRPAAKKPPPLFLLEF
jgi:hypothetical protein